ncbi:MAG: glycosyltransferase family 2 protein [Candidatus Eremiobacteraeota bacterium]|nr:glycosyltransferase family 2 protein [Candidatus Eremiobacteraeota bacterium]
MLRVSVIIPALNEEASIAGVISELPFDVFEVIVVDNGSTDRTAVCAQAAGATVVHEPIPGYGRACAAGASAASNCSEILVFLDGDGSDDPALLPQLLAPILKGDIDFVIGSRIRGVREVGSMSAAQLVAGKIAGVIMWQLYGVHYTDMCPFRAIRHEAFLSLGMQEQTYGWNVEMQMKAAHQELRILEIPVPHRVRLAGVSKVAGSFAGTVRAAARILETLARIAWKTRRGPQAKAELAS